MPCFRNIVASVLAMSLSATAQAAAGEISFWNWRPEDRAQWRELLDKFEQAHPDIKVTLQTVDSQNYTTVLSAALAAGQGPDTVLVRAYGGMEQFARAGYLLPLTKDMVPELENLPQPALDSETLRADGKVYASSIASQAFGLFVNNRLFEEAGLEPPKTWDELMAACETFNAQGIFPLANGMGTAFMVEAITGTLTANMLGADFAERILAGETTFAGEEYVGALEKLLEVRDCLPRGFEAVDHPTMQQLFTSERAAMFVGGSFEIAGFRRQNPDLDMNFVAPPAMEAGEPQYVSVWYDGGFAINANTPNLEDSITFVRWATSPEFGNEMTRLLANISPIAGVEIEDEILAQVAELSKTSVPYIMLVHFRYENPTGSSLLQRAIQQMMAGDMTPQQVGDEVTAGIATYFEPFQSAPNQ